MCNMQRTFLITSFCSQNLLQFTKTDFHLFLFSMAPSSMRVYTPARASKRRRSTTTTVTTKAAKGRIFLPARVSFSRQVLPKQLFNSLRYSEIVSVSTDVNGNGNVIWGCNRMVDPYITGAGHAPLYFAQIAALYNHFCVLKARIKLSCIQDSGASYVMMATWVDDDSNGNNAAGDSGQERPGAKSVIAFPSQGISPILRHSWDAVKAFGPNIQANPSMQGTITTDPTEQQTWITFYRTPAGSVNLKFFVEIEYDVVWDELKSISQ